MGCTRARVRARGPTHPLCTRTPDDGLDEGGGWFLAEGRREREGGREGGNRGIEISILRAIPPGVSGPGRSLRAPSTTSTTLITG